MCFSNKKKPNPKKTVHSVEEGKKSVSAKPKSSQGSYYVSNSNDFDYVYSTLSQNIDCVKKKRFVTLTLDDTVDVSFQIDTGSDNTLM